MSSIRKIQECVDEIFAIHNQTKEMYEEADEVFKDLSNHQKEFIGKTEKITQQLEFLMQHQIDMVRVEADKAISSHRTVVNEYNGVIWRFEKVIDDLHEQKYEKLEKLRQTRVKILAPLICLAMLLGGLNYYLTKKAYAKYSAIQGTPTIFKRDGDYWVKVKPNTETTWVSDGKELKFAKMA